MLNFLRRIINKPSFGSKNYWESRYEAGGNSGSGSYGKLADFKAKVINDFVAKNNINTVIEFGCGDGNQLSLASYKHYIGLDVSHNIIKKCADKFSSDKTKSFFIYDGEAFIDNAHIFRCELSLSLDVIYHLVEQRVYEQYLTHLFDCGKQYVLIYSSNKNTDPKSTAIHERHREFTQDVAKIANDWELVEIIENEFAPKGWNDEEGSIANFYIYKKR